MKSIIFLVCFTITWFVSISQETIDTTNIVTSYNTDGFFVKSYHLKNQNHFAKSDKSSYYLEIDGEISLSDNAKEILSNIVIETMQNKKKNLYFGRTIWLSLLINFRGEVTSVMIGLDKNDALGIDFSKQEVKQIMQKIKKNVQFDIVREFKYKDRFISMTVPVRIK
jgi:hypothetical protein